MGDAADRSDDAIEMANAEALERHRERQLLVSASTRHAVPGEARECVECGDGIASARLVALPYTEHCVDCAQANETRRKVTYGRA